MAQSSSWATVVGSGQQDVPRMPRMHPRSEEEFPSPSSKGAEILYVLQGGQGEFQYGKTSFSSPLIEEFAIPISSFDFESNRQAMDYLAALRICKGSSIVEGYFVDDKRVLLERVGQDILSYVDSEYRTWSEKSCPIEDWWSYIQPKVMPLFSDISMALRKIYSLGYCSTRLLDGISVVNQKAKLIWVKRAIHSSELYNAKFKDIEDFHSLMAEVIVKPYREDNDFQWRRLRSYFKEQRLSNEFSLFLKDLRDPKYVGKVDICWLLDDSSFWNGTQKKKFIMKLWDILHDRKLFDGIILDPCVMKYIPNWHSNIPPPGNPGQGVFAKIQNDKYLFGQRHGHVTPESTAVEVTRFYRGMIVHYNDHLNFRQPRIEKSDISLIADAIFHGACAILRRACADVWYPKFENKSIVTWDAFMGFLMSEIDF